MSTQEAVVLVIGILATLGLILGLFTIDRVYPAPAPCECPCLEEMP